MADSFLLAVITSFGLGSWINCKVDNVVARISIHLPAELHTTSDGSSINDRGAGHRILQRFRHFVRSGRGLHRMPVTLATEQVIPPSSRGSARDRCRDWLCRPRHQSTGDEGFGTVGERISLRNAWHTTSAFVVRRGPKQSACVTTHRTACARARLRAKATAARGHRLRTPPGHPRAPRTELSRRDDAGARTSEADWSKPE
jgi:hypothetical protein